MHTLVVAEYLESFGYSASKILSGLHHDDPEFCIGDVTRPLKDEIGPLYRPVEDRMWDACSKAMDFDSLGVTIDEDVKKADDWALSAEAFYIMRSKGRGWWCEGLYNHRDRKQWKVAQSITRYIHFPEHVIKVEWVARHHQLVKRVKREFKDD